MLNYLDLLYKVLNKGERHDNRTDIYSLSLFGEHFEHDMRTGFPLLTTKKVHFKSIVGELFWFLSGSTNNADLRARGVTIWDEWATAEKCAKFGRPENELGHVYGGLWRNFLNKPKAQASLAVNPSLPSCGVFQEVGVEAFNDQIYGLCYSLEHESQSRRLIVSGWHAVEQRLVELPPCHTLFQVKCHGDNELSLMLFMRSCDIFLGAPFNIASYAVLLEMLAYATGRTARFLKVTYGDLHLYSNHIDQANLQLSRPVRELPSLTVKPEEWPAGSVFSRFMSFTPNDLHLEGYDPHPAIKAEVAV